jgi:hypothetical protein
MFISLHKAVVHFSLLHCKILQLIIAVLTSIFRHLYFSGHPQQKSSLSSSWPPNTISDILQTILTTQDNSAPDKSTLLHATTSSTSIPPLHIAVFFYAWVRIQELVRMQEARENSEDELAYWVKEPGFT